MGRVSNELCSSFKSGGDLQVRSDFSIVSLSINAGKWIFFRLILAKGGNFDLQDTNGCTVTHIMVVWDNIKMFDMAVECGAAINIENNQGPHSNSNLTIIYSLV